MRVQKARFPCTYRDGSFCYICSRRNEYNFMTRQKSYTELTAEEQLQYCKDLEKFSGQVPHLEQLKGSWSAADREAMEQGLRLMQAFAFSESFATDALRYGDYSSRTYRLRFYCDKIKKELVKSLNVSGGNGQPVAIIDPTVPTRRRGRPSLAEVEARKKGEDVAKEDTGLELQRQIAQMMGMKVIVTDNAPREKNNAELAEERKAKQAAEEKMNPSLFSPTPDTSPKESGEGQTTEGASPVVAPTIADLGETRYHLNQLRILLSPSLQERVDSVQGLRTSAASAAETAKRMAERGEKPEDVEPYAREAAQLTEAYEQIYDDVDNELATLHYRLKNDEPYRKQFQEKYHISDLTRILDDLKPYYKKVQSPEFYLRCKTLIEQESPEYAAKVKAEAERKKEVQDILRYLKRKDRPATDARLNGAREKFARLEQLLGKKEAKDYKPLLAFIEDENRKLNAEKKQKK